MSAPISTPPWDLAAGNRWTIQSEDHRIANDRGNETVVDAKGNVVAYVAGGMENGNGALLAKAPDLAALLKRYVDRDETLGEQITELNRLARAALKQAGAL